MEEQPSFLEPVPVSSRLFYSNWRAKLNYRLSYTKTLILSVQSGKNYHIGTIVRYRFGKSFQNETKGKARISLKWSRPRKARSTYWIAGMAEGGRVTDPFIASSI